MKKHLLLASLLIGSTIAFAQNFVWAKSLGGTSSDVITSITVDASGNVYTTGKFDGTADFDPGIGTFTLTSVGTSDIFVSKLDVNGNFVWAKQFGGTYNEVANVIKVDASGNVFLAGSFSDPVDFDPGAGTLILDSPSGFDIFVSKWDTDGNFIWVKQMGGVGNQTGIDMTMDTTGNIYTTGYFAGTPDFDPGASTYTLSAIGTNDVYVSKLDVNGDFVWVKSIGSASTSNLNSNSIELDASGNVYTSGYFNGTLDFDPGATTYTLTSFSSVDIFVSKLDASGNFIWAKQIGGSGTDTPTSMVTDTVGNIYLTGANTGTIDFDPSAATYTLSPIGTYDIFVSKLDSSGNFVFAKTFGGGTGYPESGDITLDATGNIYTTGYIDGTVDFDPGVGTMSISLIGTYDAFISKLDAMGNFVWAKTIGGSAANAFGSRVTIDASGNIYTSGAYSSTIDFDPSTGVSDLTAQGNNDVFVLKLSPSPVGIAETTNEFISMLFPNPTDKELNIRTNETIETISIFNLLGERILIETKNNFSIESLPMGMYIVKIKTNKGSGTTRFIKN
ncbi:MAG: SBBP repeat-containing protein [Bacteroidota bacterium]|nr:SBBP repeat-containing protein [Bacteroidota bacterium]